MRKLYIIIFTFLLNNYCKAQVSFQNGYGDTLSDKGRVIISTSTGGYCIVGPSGQNFTDSSDVAVYMINSVGDLILSVKIGLPGDEIPTGVVETDNGDFIICGTTHASPVDTINTDIFAMRIAPLSGFVFWSKVYGGAGNDEANSIIRTPEGSFLILGSSTSFDSTAKQALVLNIYETGDQKWCSATKALNENFFNRGDITIDGNYILGGGSSDGTDINNYIVKMDTVGSVLWSRRFGTIGTDWINDIKSTADSGYVVAGITTMTTAGDTDQNIIKLDSAGNVIWSNNYGTSNTDVANSILPIFNGGFIVSGYSMVVGPGSTLNQMIMSEINSAGSITWSKSYGSQVEACDGFCLTYGADGGFAACGSSVAFNEPNGDVFFVKIDNVGFSGCFEFPITFASNTTTIADSSGSVQQLVLPYDSMVTLINNDYVNQFTQNCFFNGIASFDLNNSIKIFPNPANSILNIETEFENADATIIDCVGKVLSNHKLTFSLSSLDISDLVPGIYFIEINSGNNFSVKKFVKE